MRILIEQAREAKKIARMRKMRNEGIGNVDPTSMIPVSSLYVDTSTADNHKILVLNSIYPIYHQQQLDSSSKSSEYQ